MTEIDKWAWFLTDIAQFFLILCLFVAIFWTLSAIKNRMRNK